MEPHGLEPQGLREYLLHPRNRSQIQDQKSPHNECETRRIPGPLTPFLLPSPVERLPSPWKQEYKNLLPPKLSLAYPGRDKYPRSLLVDNNLYLPNQLVAHSS